MPRFAQFVLILLLALSPPMARAADRVALVIGNSAYAHVPGLDNPANDASDIARTLEGLGYSVTLRMDLGRAGMIAALGDFRRTAFGAEQAIIYYAGHGIEVDRVNYLIPAAACPKDPQIAAALARARSN